jgi:uncharacterized protein (TIRG00374 family)
LKKKRFAIRASVLVGFVLSGLFLWLALSQVDLRGLALTFAAIHVAPVVLCIIAQVGSMVLRARRWRLVAGLPRTCQHSFSRATYLGILVNLLFPGRVGEFIRVITLAKLTESTLPLPLASAILDRLIDVIVLITLAGVLFFLLPLDHLLAKWLGYLLTGTAVLCAGLAFFLKGEKYWENHVAMLTERWLQRWSLRPDVFLSELKHEFSVTLRGWNLVEVALFAGAIMMCDYFSVFALFLAFDIPLTIATPLLVQVCLSAGSMLPSAPSYVGVYQAAAVVAFTFISQPPEKAIALATVLQLITLTVAMALNGRGVIGLTRRARLAWQDD